MSSRQSVRTTVKTERVSSHVEYGVSSHNRTDSKTERRNASDGDRVNRQWKPVVEMADTSVSPLACKIVSFPKFDSLPGKFRMHQPLDELDPRIQESLILEDLLYVLCGCEGRYLRFAEAYDPTIQVDTLEGPDYRISKALEPSLKDLTKSIVICAGHYIAVKSFVEIYSKSQYGLVSQALCASLRGILKDYLLTISQLQHQVLHNPDISLHNFHLDTLKIAHILKHSYNLCQDILRENSRKHQEFSSSNNAFQDNFDKILESLKDVEIANLNEFGASILGSNSKSSYCKGGSILRIIAQRLTSYYGDTIARSVLERLLKDASVPYLKMLNLWINKGIIEDPYDEFLIREQKSIKKDKIDRDYTDQYWEKRYTVRKSDLPLLLSSPQIYERILLTGKYLNVVRECGGTDVSKDINYQFESIQDSDILTSLASAYSHANESLLKLLIQTHDLETRIRSLKHYFFLDRADFLINFMDIAEKELLRPSKLASVTKLQYLLDMSLRQPGSISSDDPFKDEVLVDMNHISVSDYLLKIVKVTGLDPKDALAAANNQIGLDDKLNPPAQKEEKSKPINAILGLQLDFKITFPLSLVFSRKTILRYQLMFRYLVEMKYIVRVLNNTWIEQHKSFEWKYESSNSKLQRWKTQAINLRVKLQLFIQHVLYYATTEVIEPNFTKFQAKLRTSKSADTLMEHHVFFLDACMKECMLTNEKLLKVQAKLFYLCRSFAEYLLNRIPMLCYIDPEMLSDKSRRNLQPLTGKNGEVLTADDIVDSLVSSLSQYEKSVDRHVKILIEMLNYYAVSETSVLMSLSARLDGS